MMIIMADDAAQWLRALNDAVAGCAILSRVCVICDVDSTQDEARRRALLPGDVVVAMRQTHGRGRRGSTWLDTGSDGVAFTAVVPADDGGRLSIACAVAAAWGIEAVATAPLRAGVKWPNDLILCGAKVGGVLIEVRDASAIVGIGINVLQCTWPPDLSEQAISLVQAGIKATRLDVICSTLTCLDRALRADPEVIRRAFSERDVLTGSRVRLRYRQEELTGAVTAIDPFRCITIETDLGPRDLPAHLTTILTAEGDFVHK